LDVSFFRCSFEGGIRVEYKIAHMKKIRILQVVFENEIEPYELPAFRAAIIEQTGRKYDLFHNHSENTQIYRYPLIQYKRVYKNPAILCIEEGVDQLHHFFEKKGEVIMIGDRQVELKVKQLQMNQFTMQVWDSWFYYNIENWVALNDENYQKFNLIESLSEQLTFLEKTLIANIIAFAKGINWTIDKEVKVNITQLNEPKIIKIKDTRFTTYNLSFRTNIFLPNYLGLGKSVSKGFGKVIQIKERS